MILVVNDESFYNILGQEVSKSGLVQEMVNYYQSKLEVGETSVTDFNEGSEIRNLLESFAIDLYILLQDNYESSKIAFVPTAYGEWLDLHGQHPLLQLERDTGTEAVGLVTFTLADVSTEDTVISEGTVLVSTENNLEYVTDNDCTILAGDLTTDCFCTCLTVGKDGNCSANTVTIIDDTTVDNSISVNNTEGFAGGTDHEEDDVYRERLLNYVNKDSFGSYAYYVALAEKIEGVHDVSLVDATGYTKKVIVNGDVKPTPDNVLVQVLAEFSDVEKIVLKHNFTVALPAYDTVNMTVNLNVDYELTTAEINELLSCFFDGGTTSNNYTFEGLNIDEKLTKENLYGALETFDAVTNVQVVVGGSELSSLTPTSNGVFKLGTVTINQTVNG